MKINLCTPNLMNKEAILSNMESCLDSNWIASGGKFNHQVEDFIREYTGAKYAVTVGSGTSALHLAYKAIGLKQNDEVIVPTATFIATINPVVYEKANPIFFDCDDSLNINLEQVAEFLENNTEQIDGKCINKNTNAHIKLIVPVHIFGNPVDMVKLNEIAKTHNIKVVEDAAESLGSFFDKNEKTHTGICSDIGIFSFNANKIITSAGGGVVITNNKEYADKIRYWSEQSKNDTVRFVHDELGYNYRMSDVHAALLCEQLPLLNEFREIKKNTWSTYKELVEDIDYLEVLNFHENSSPNFWFSNLIVDIDKVNKDINEIIDTLQKDYDIQTRPLWFLNHDQKFLNKFECQNTDKAEWFIKRIISIPCSTHITKTEQEHVIKAIQEIVAG